MKHSHGGVRWSEQHFITDMSQILSGSYDYSDDPVAHTTELEHLE